MNWKSEIALITGASRGLGRALAFEITRRGGTAVLVARAAAPLEATRLEIAAEGGKVYAIAADVADIRSVYPVVARASELAGPITLLVNNASTLGPVPLRPWLETECEDFTKALETNLVAPFRLTKAVLGGMLVRRHGTVVNLSSDAAVSAYPNWGVYSASKAGLAHLTRIWSEEIGPSPVRLISFDPGEMDTVMHADAIPEADRSTLQTPESVALRLIEILEKKS